jgi:hypothetical protein
MDYLMLRTFDQAGYYETRLILTLISLAVAAYFLYYKRDRRYLLIFASGVLLQTLTKFGMQWIGVRNTEPAIMFFGTIVPVAVTPLVQGISEGGIVSLFAFWFADLRAAGARPKEWGPFYGLCALVAALSFLVGVAASGHSVTSARPIFAPASILAVTVIIFVCVMIAWRQNDISPLVWFYAGLLLFALLTYEPMHAMGVRYIGIPNGPNGPNGTSFVAAPLSLQIVIMLLSHLFEVAGGKLHYFMLPYAFGLLTLRDREDRGRERYSTQHLADLASRGWRKRSKPFPQ